MGLVEAVARELLHQLEHALGHLLLDAPSLGPLEELGALLGHELRDLLAHRLPEVVGLAHREAGHVGGDLEHLLLVDHDPVGLLEVLLHDGVVVRRLHAPVPSRGEVGNHLHGPGPVERDHRDHVLEALGPELAKGVAHPRRLELEHPERPRVRQELVGLGVVERESLGVEADSPAFLDESDRVGDDGERPEAQEVHLEKAELLDGAHGVLGDDLLALGVPVERDVLHQRLVGDHDSGGVLAGVAGQTLEPLGRLPELGDLGPSLDRLGERRALADRVVQRDVQRVGDELGDLVHVPERHAQDAPDVPDDRLGLQHVEGDDLRHPVPPVPAHDVLDDLVAPVVGEVDVHVRHGLPAWVQKSLEDKTVTQRIYSRNTEAVGDQRRGRRAPARPDGDPLLLRVPDEVPDHQEVGGELHGLDDAELVVEPGPDLRRGLGVVPSEARLCHFAEVGVQRVVRGHLVAGQAELPERQLEVAPLGDGKRVRASLGQVLEHLVHLLGRLQVELFRRELPPVGIGDLGAGLQAEEHLVGPGVRCLEIVRVVGAADPDSEGPRDAEGSLGHADLVGEAVRLDLREVVVTTEDVRVPGGDLERLPLLPGQEQPRHLGVEASGQDQEAVRVLGEELLVDPGLVVEPFEVAAGDELDEVVVPGLVPDEDGDVVGALVLSVDRRALEPAAGGHVELAAQDGLDAGGPRVLDRSRSPRTGCRGR